MLFFLDYAAQAKLHRSTATKTQLPERWEKRGDGQEFVATIVLAPRIRFAGAAIPAGAEIDALHERAHHDCFIANSVTTAISIARRD